MEKVLIQHKVGKAWKTEYEHTDTQYIYESLANDMLHHYIHKARYIKRITDKSNYDGTREITVTYDNNVRRVYTIVNR